MLYAYDTTALQDGFDNYRRYNNVSVTPSVTDKLDFLRVNLNYVVRHDRA